MTSAELQKNLYDTMKLFSENAINNSNAARTVEGRINKIIDEEKGIYKVEYLGNYFEAYATSSSPYSIGDTVILLLQEGDFSKKKIILGSLGRQIVVNVTYATEEDILEIFKEEE